MGADSAPLPCKAAAKPPQRACPEFAKMETKGLFPNFGVFKVRQRMFGLLTAS